MCGINGILNFVKERLVSQAVLIRMRDALAHRGPDDKGIFAEENIGFGHRRLSILDTSSAGHQPFFSEDGRYVMVFNGEIYNFRDFYAEIKNSGLGIKTHSDTEVLLKLFQLHGTSMLNRLNGMFAFAIWDKQDKKLTLVRDRMGVKPLYYTVFEDSLYFGSEQKALFAAGVPLQISQDGLEEYIFNRFVAGENTLFKNVKKLLPGHIMTVESDGNTTFEKWWHLKEEIQNQPKIKNPTDWFRDTFDDSIRLRMVSDVPVGVLLSGGLDSSSVLASLYHQQFSDIQTFNVGFRENEHNESHLAKLMADRFDYGFQSLILEDENLFAKLGRSAYFQDEPIMHLSEPHLLAVSQIAKPMVKVLLSGEGADELMGGYVRYKALAHPTLLHSLSALANFGFLKQKPRLEKLLRYSTVKDNEGLMLYNGSNIYPSDIANKFGISEEPKNEYRKKIFAEAQELYPGNLRRQALYFDQHTYLCSLLDRNDRVTMGASIECREPFLDPRLVIGLGSLDDKWLFTGKKGKYILKTSMQKRLPEEILTFRKIGLSAPWGTYVTRNPAFADEMAEFEKSPIFDLPYFENIDIKSLILQLKNGDTKATPYVIPLFMMHIWLKNYVNNFGSTDFS